MCVVSMIVDHAYDEWTRPYRFPSWPPPQPAISPEELEEFRRLLERAREYDKKHSQPDCELEAKKEKLRKLAKELGVELPPL